MPFCHYRRSSPRCRSYPRLEGLLDWLLSIYKFAFPFLIISMVARLSGGNGGEAGEGFASAGSGGWEPAAPCAGRLAPQQAWAGDVRALPNAAAAAEGAPAGAGVGGEGGSEEDLGEGYPVASLGRRASGYGELLDEGKPARLPSRVLPRTVSGGEGFGAVWDGLRCGRGVRSWGRVWRQPGRRRGDLGAGSAVGRLLCSKRITSRHCTTKT